MERKVRGIDVIVKAAERKKKRELPLQFANNWSGELHRIGYRCTWRHCFRYSIPFSLEDTRDSIAEAIASLWEAGKLQATLEQGKLSLEEEDKINFCREVVNVYRRLIHANKKSQAEFTLDVIVGPEKHYQWRPNRPEEEISWIETKESLKQTLSRLDYATCQLLIQGYSQGEVAKMLKVNRRTLRRRLDRLPSGRLLRILRE
jgi:hypothetical protein